MKIETFNNYYTTIKETGDHGVGTFILYTNKKAFWSSISRTLFCLMIMGSVPVIT